MQQAAPRHSGWFDDLQAAIDAIDNGVIRPVLRSLLEQAKTDTTNGITALAKLNYQIQSWYDQTMDRVSGWYKRPDRQVVLGGEALRNHPDHVCRVARCRVLV